MIRKPLQLVLDSRRRTAPTALDSRRRTAPTGSLHARSVYQLLCSYSSSVLFHTNSLTIITVQHINHPLFLLVLWSNIYAFSRRFYPKRLTIAFRLYIFISMCVPWESNPQPFALLTQCSTTEPHSNIPDKPYGLTDSSTEQISLHRLDTFIFKYINIYIQQISSFSSAKETGPLRHMWQTFVDFITR